MRTTDLAGTRILIAEDEPLEALDYCDRLRSAGAKIVGPCATVRDALVCLDRGEIDVAVVDHALADENSARLQDALEHRNIPFVVLTGYPRVLVRRGDKQNVLAKPVSSDLLCNMVRAVCTSRGTFAG